jgi:N-acetylneuraminate synthase
VGLNILGELRKRYGCPVGISDHSGQIYASLAAIVLGASLIEVHVTLSRRAFGPDVPASLEPDELQRLVYGVRQLELMLANPVDKDEISRAMAGMQTIFSKSLVAARDLSAGSRIKATDISMKKPGTGIPVARLNDYVDRRLRRDVTRDRILTEDDFEPATPGAAE